MRYQLKPITQENWRTAITLEVAPHQQGLIEDNPTSLLEANYDPNTEWTPIGLYVDHQMVGFAMIGQEKKVDNAIWFDRFMIDHRQQKQGYGHALFRSVLTYLKDHYKSVDTVYLNVRKENQKAFPFYESFGFSIYDDAPKKDDVVIMSCPIIREEE